MIGRTIANYKIVEKLGEGGMGVVYRARDTHLDRDVAIKFLPSHLTADEEAKARFVHEAKAASALDHNNIGVIHQISETDDGEMFLVMTCYDGRTLKDVIAGSPLGPEQALHVAIQIASGLSKAHEKGILHRDIKPANILITHENDVKILDFGLAKIADRTRVTRTGSTIGTVAYMSPEQAKGKDVDVRADVWSLGVCLYEIVSGKLPFRGDIEAAMIYSLLSEPHTPLDNYVDVSDGLVDIIERALAKDPNDRFQTIDEMLERMHALVNDPSARTERPAVAARPPSVAVLPFVDMSPEKDQEYFCDGIAEELMHALGSAGQIRVASRTAAFQFKGGSVDAKEIGDKLDVQTVLEGSVRKAGDRLRITTQLFDTRDGFQMWTERFDRELADVFDIQDEISQAVVSELVTRLRSAGDTVAGRKREAQAATTADIPIDLRPTDSVEAYDAYLRGKYFYNKGTQEDAKKAIEMYERATELDPTFALAHAALGEAYEEYHFTYDPTGGYKAKAHRSINRALELDPGLPEAYVARGKVTWCREYGFPHEEAIKDFQRSIALNPNLAEAYDYLGSKLYHIGLIDRAVIEVHKSLRLNPLSTHTRLMLGLGNFFGGRFEAALDALDETVEVFRGDLHGWIVSLSLLHLDRGEEATKALSECETQFGSSPFVTSTRAIFLAMDGANDAAEEKIKYSLDEGKDFGHFHHIACNVADAYAVMGNNERAVHWLRDAAGDGFPCYPWFVADPCLEALSGDPAFEQFMDEQRVLWKQFQRTI